MFRVAAVFIEEDLIDAQIDIASADTNDTYDSPTEPPNLNLWARARVSLL
jgi:hypothetical protein